jgi:hypothetical protein
MLASSDFQRVLADGLKSILGETRKQHGNRAQTTVSAEALQTVVFPIAFEAFVSRDSHS